jgi:hypothetical protein
MHPYLFFKGPKIAIFIEAKSGQFLNFYDHIQVTRTLHTTCVNFAQEFLFPYLLQKFKI